MFDTHTPQTPIRPNQTRLYTGGRGYPCTIKEVHEKHAVIEINGVTFEMPLFTIGEEV
jgi:hypothetical protein